MNKMLTVKNAIERVIQGQVAVCLAAVTAGIYNRQHFTEMAEFVEKFVASLYVSGQIDREFSIESSLSATRLTVKFAVEGHYSIVDNVLPAVLYYTAMKQEPVHCAEELPLPEITYTQFDDYQDAVSQFNAEKNLIKEQAQARELMEDRLQVAPDVIDAYERAKKFIVR